MIKSITITERQWDTLKNRIKEDYPPSVLLSRSRMKGTLGFTPRRQLVNERGIQNIPIFHLDFFSDKKKTFFLVKYSDIINDKKEINNV